MKCLTILAAFALASCGPIRALPPAASPLAEATKLDENIGRTATNAYTAASTLGRELALAGHIDKARFKALDRKGYELVLAIRAAYEAGSAASYVALITRLNAIVTQIKEL